MLAAPGDTIEIELTVVNESAAFNGYDARVAYDPAPRPVVARMGPKPQGDVGKLLAQAPHPGAGEELSAVHHSVYYKIDLADKCAVVKVNALTYRHFFEF